MKRYRAIKPAVGVSLFPFLAVLICTMGALIVLLVLVVQLAKVNASEDDQVQLEPTAADTLRMAKEDLEWQRDQLEIQRQQVKEDVGNNRLKLSHLEQHIRELEQRWNQLGKESKDLQERIQGGGQDQETAEELAKLHERILATKDALDAAREQAANQPPLYAIVPYVGPNGTHRRPVYLECTETAITIQPEGVRLTEEHFQGPLGSGNPLDAALRAIREYYVRAGARSVGEPYPLLIVRPSGVETYAIARSAMRNWDDEFGYELIDESMKIKYPDADPALARFLEKVIADARARQKILATAMPSRPEQADDVGFVASPAHGGFVPQGGHRVTGTRRGGFGRGGDSRYVDGQAGGPVAGTAPETGAQSVGGPTGKGVSQGVAGQPGQAQGAAPVAKSRGADWGLPNLSAGTTGIIRPIRIACLRDRVIILPERGIPRSPEVVFVQGSMLDEIDTLVSKIWDRIEDWGIAVAGGYWKPVLRVDVAQGADERYEELRILLEGSGLEVKRNSQ